MEHSYIYGTVRLNGELVENLKTKGPTHTDLSGFISSVQEYADSVVTDRCLIVEKYRSAEDEEGNCYDWYVIDKHYCYVDETKSLNGALAAGVSRSVTFTRTGGAIRSFSLKLADGDEWLGYTANGEPSYAEMAARNASIFSFLMVRRLRNSQ